MNGIVRLFFLVRPQLLRTTAPTTMARTMATGFTTTRPNFSPWWTRTASTAAASQLITVRSFSFSTAAAFDPSSKDPFPAELLPSLDKFAQDPNRKQIHTCNWMMQRWCEVGRIDDAVELFRRMRHERKEMYAAPDDATHSFVISTLWKAGRGDQAVKLFKEITSDGSCKDVLTFTAMLDGFMKSEQPGEAQELFGIMKRTRKPAPNHYSYTTMIDGLNKNGLAAEADAMLAEMRQAGVIANVVTINSSINGLMRRGEVDAAMKVFERMKTTGDMKPDLFMLNIVIDGLVRNNRDAEAVVIFEDMRAGRHGFPSADVVTCTIIAGLLARTTGIDKAEKMVRMMARQEDGLPLPNENSCNTLLKVMMQKGEVDAALKLFQDMRSGTTGFPAPDVVTCGTIVAGLGRAHRIDEAVELVEQMKPRVDNRLPAPNVVIYSSLISGLCAANRREKALELARKMIEEKEPMNVYSFGPLILAGVASWKHSPDFLLQVVEQMEIANVAANDKIIGFLSGIRDPALVKRVAAIGKSIKTRK